MDFMAQNTGISPLFKFQLKTRFWLLSSTLCSTYIVKECRSHEFQLSKCKGKKFLITYLPTENASYISLLFKFLLAAI